MLITLHTDRCELRVDDEGETGLPVIFAHALGGHQGQWSGPLAHQQEHRRGLAFDLAGHDGTPPPRDGDYSIPAMGGDLLTVLERRRVERAVFVGHSLGAWVATAAAAAAPDRCAGLVLLDPGSDPSTFPEEMAEAFLRELDSSRYEQAIESYFGELLQGATHETRRDVLHSLAQTSPEVIRGCLRQLGSFRATEALQRWGGPTFVIAGPFGRAEGAVQTVLGLPTEEIAGGSHWFHMDDPRVVIRALDRTLAGLEREVRV